MRAPARALSIEMRDITTPVPPAPGWALVRPALSGICATDLDRLQAAGEPSLLDAYAGTDPVVPGHEVVGVVERAVGTRWAREGQRVLVEPILRCIHKGLPECRRCRAGDTHLCENRDRSGALCSGPAIGTSPHAGGAWSEGFLVHEDMLVPADGISDQRGVLAEPAAAALHAALRWQRRGDRVAVTGSSAQTRLLVASLRRMHPDLEITVIGDIAGAPMKRKRRRRHAVRTADHAAADVPALRSIGASCVYQGTGEDVLCMVAEHINARRMRAVSGHLPVLDGGLDAVFDCIGTANSIDVGLRLLRGGGTFVLAGRSRRHAIEWPLVWARELTVAGASAYGREAHGQRTFAQVRDWLADPAFPIDALVTHRFPLDEFQAALQVAQSGTAAGAVKVVFEGPVAMLRSDRDTQAANQEPTLDEPLLLHATAAHSREQRTAQTPR